jgi:hypothetical protein
MPKYQVNREFWWKGIKRAVGETITMLEAQAKYIKHIVSPTAPTVSAPAPATVNRAATPAKPVAAPKAAPAAAAAAPAAAAAAAPLAVAVAEAPANGKPSN